MMKDIQIEASICMPEVILNLQNSTLFFNFHDVNREAYNDYLPFVAPIAAHLQNIIAHKQAPFYIYFDKTLEQMENSGYCRKLLEKLKSLPHQAFINYIFK